ncbi:MAG: 50S ribosomal protein L35 [Candidatus Komeilibacteria bacterium]|nr:50S ribosomal protein L35 [Candidatus Komeilibacteria bacterium]
MQKLKTHKSISKRVRLTKKKKITIIPGGQSHFNARESGKTTKNKRRTKTLHDTTGKQIKKLMPYSF